MPGRDGIRVPLRRVFDSQQDAWGYLIENCRLEQGGLHVLYNFVLFPQCFEGRDKGGCGLHDMAVLMEHNHEDNVAWLKEHGQDDYQCWSDLWGKYEGETLVIASCGPSLTQSLPALYRRRKDYRLMCLNRSMRPFMEPEMKPDFYYFVERRGIPDWICEVEAGTGKPGEIFDLSGITMIGTPQCDRNIVRRFDPDKCYWGYTELGALGHIPAMKRLKKFDIKAATTIGNAPFIAWKLGFKKLILVGCDFSIECQLAPHPEDKSKHVVEPTRMYFDRDWNGTHYAKDPQWIRRAIPVIGNDNRAVMLDPLLAGHRTYLEAALDICHFDAGMWCANASPRGTLMFNNMDLDAALDHPGFSTEEPCESSTSARPPVPVQ